jgi:phosphatidylethanolamine-binding protein (PEBP) family uncharacterized protein
MFCIAERPINRREAEHQCALRVGLEGLGLQAQARPALVWASPSPGTKKFVLCVADHPINSQELTSQLNP